MCFTQTNYFYILLHSSNNKQFDYENNDSLLLFIMIIGKQKVLYL